MQQSFAAVILAGGGGCRMGGVDTAFVELAGRPLLAHVLNRLRPQTNRILLSANGDLSRFDNFDLPIVTDRRPDLGPLAGIAEAAAESWQRWPDVRLLLTVPVDSPLLPLDLGARLTAAVEHTGRPAVAEAGRRIHWTIGVWPVRTVLMMYHKVTEGGLRRVEDAVRQAGGTAVGFASPCAFANVNTPADLERVAQSLGDS